MIIATCVSIVIAIFTQVKSLIEIRRVDNADVKQLATKSLLLSFEVITTLFLLFLSVFTDTLFIYVLVGAFIIFTILILNCKSFSDEEYRNRYGTIFRMSLFRLIFSISSLTAIIISSWLLDNGHQFAGNFLNLLIYILFALFYLITSFSSVFMVESFRRWLVEKTQMAGVPSAETERL